VVVVSVLDEPLAPMVLLLPVEPEPVVLLPVEPEPVEPEAPIVLPLPEPVEPVEPDEPVEPVEPVEPEAPIDDVDGELVDDEPVAAVSLLLLGVDVPVVEPVVPEAPSVLLEPVEPVEPLVLGEAAVEPAADGLPAFGPVVGDGLRAEPLALPPPPAAPEPDAPEPWATAMPLMARAAAAASVVSVFLVALMSTP